MTTELEKPPEQKHRTPSPNTAKKLKLFLYHLSRSKSPAGAAELVNFSLRSFHRWRAQNAEFAERWEEALEVGTDRLEDVATYFATEGIVEFEQTSTTTAKDGSVTVKKMVKRRVSDRLLIAMLEARRPDKFRVQRDRPADPGGGSMGSSDDARKRIEGRLDVIARRTDGTSSAGGEVVPLREDDAAGSGGA